MTNPNAPPDAMSLKDEIDVVTKLRRMLARHEATNAVAALDALLRHARADEREKTLAYIERAYCDGPIIARDMRADVAAESPTPKCAVCGDGNWLRCRAPIHEEERT